MPSREFAWIIPSNFRAPGVHSIGQARLTSRRGRFHRVTGFTDIGDRQKPVRGATVHECGREYSNIVGYKAHWLVRVPFEGGMGCLTSFWAEASRPGE